MTVAITQVKMKSTESGNQNLQMKGSMFLKDNTKQCKKNLINKGATDQVV